MIVYFDSTDKRCKSIIGAVKEGEEVTFKVFTDLNGGVIKFRTDDNSFFEFEGKRESDGIVFKVFGLKKNLYFYRFYLDGLDFGSTNDCFAVERGEDFQFSVTDKNYSYPSTFSGGVIYQIFPDRFARAENCGKINGRKMKKWGEMPDYLPDENGKITNDDFFGGNFKGIENKLGYLKSLGVDLIYLNPISKAHSNHRYDTGDFNSFDELLGTDEDFKSLVRSAKKEGIRIILDGVFNHVGDDSVYFNKYGRYSSVGAYSSKKSPYYKWFTFEEYPNKYRSWWGIDVLPSIKRGSKSFENFIAGENGVLDRLFSFGIDGIRLDVVDELSDKFVKKINDKVKSYGKEKLIIGEVWEDATDKIAYNERKRYFIDGELDSVMNYPLKESIISYVLSGNAKVLYDTVRRQIDRYPKEVLSQLMNVLGTHDTARILTVLGKRGNLKTSREEMANEKLSYDEYDFGKRALKVASLLSFTLYGVPSIYYGDEIGIQGNKDPFNRTCFIPEKGDEELLEWFKTLGKIRKEFDCFKEVSPPSNVFFRRGVFGFSRRGETSTVTVVINCSLNSENIVTEKSFECFKNEKLSKITLKHFDFAMFYKIEKQE